jgi:hypothetical protein
MVLRYVQPAVWQLRAHGRPSRAACCGSAMKSITGLTTAPPRHLAPTLCRASHGTGSVMLHHQIISRAARTRIVAGGRAGGVNDGRGRAASWRGNIANGGGHGRRGKRSRRSAAASRRRHRVWRFTAAPHTAHCRYGWAVCRQLISLLPPHAQKQRGTTRRFPCRVGARRTRTHTPYRVRGVTDC